MKPEEAKALRAPFPAEIVGKLPRVWCKACRESRTKVCDQHTKSKCPVCKANITSAHLHLDYVGHAAVTDRLLQVDPSWSWEPMAFDERGNPLLTRNDGKNTEDEPLGLWGRLTVADTTKPAFGGGKNAKECISDLIRNGAMRFGVGLDLWSKEDLHPDTDEAPAVASQPEAAPLRAVPEPEPVEDTPEQKRARIATRWDALSLDEAKKTADGLDDIEMLRLLQQLEHEREARKRGKPRATLITALAMRIKGLEGEPSAGTAPVSEPAAQEEPDGFAPASPSLVSGPEHPSVSGPDTNGLVSADRVKAALAFIQDQPNSVENAHAWTVPGVLLGLSQRGVTASTLEEVDAESLGLVWGAIPDGVRAVVGSYGAESLQVEAAKAK